MLLRNRNRMNDELSLIISQVGWNVIRQTLCPLSISYCFTLHGTLPYSPGDLSFQILDEIAEQGIRIYQLPDADSDEDEEFKEQTRVLKVRSLPVFGGSCYSYFFLLFDYFPQCFSGRCLYFISYLPSFPFPSHPIPSHLIPFHLTP